MFGCKRVRNLHLIIHSEMPYFHLRLSFPNPPPSCVPNTLLRPRFGYVVEYTQFHSNKVHLNHHVAVIKNMSPLFAFASTFPRFYPSGALQISVEVGEASDSERCQSKVTIDSSENHTLNKKDQVMGYSNSPESFTFEVHKERLRRRKIGLANKGKVPWNKGKKHNAETRERIKQRTREALRDPKVRKKMSEHPRAHSDHIKSKISSSLRHVWQERLKRKWLRERFFLSWAESIAKAAKQGGSDQQELDWDSYDKIKQEIVLQQLQWAAEKAKAKQTAKQMAKTRAEKLKRMAKTRAEKFFLSWAESIAKAAKKGGNGQQELDWDSYNKIKQEMFFQQLQLAAKKVKAREKEKIRARLAQKRKELKVKSKTRGETKRKTHRESKEDKDELAVAQESTLKQKLAKIYTKKSINGQGASGGDIVVSPFRAWEKLDLELIKREKMRRDVSLADQIRAARNKKAESAAREALAASSSDYPSSENS